MKIVPLKDLTQQPLLPDTPPLPPNCVKMPNGEIWDTVRLAFVHYCSECGNERLSRRITSVTTCSPKCRKRRSRRLNTTPPPSEGGTTTSNPTPKAR